MSNVINHGVSALDSPEFVAKFRSALLETFAILIDYLETNNYKWWVAYGTCIGAVRHHGLIPWDDDIDIWMPRTDYERFLKNRDKLSKDYNVLSLYDEGYAYSFAKFFSKKNTIWEAEQFPYAIGAFIDIFPLDLVEAPKAEKIAADYYPKLRKYVMGRDVLNMSAVKNYLNRRQYKALAYAFYSKFASFIFHNKNKNTFDKAHIQLISNQKGDVYADIFSTKAMYYKSQLFKGFEYMPFDGLMVRVPSGYDELLRSYYGDYMQLPPENQRVARHQFSYVNLNEGLTLQDIKKRVRNGERCVY